jgi:inner membrane protein
MSDPVVPNRQKIPESVLIGLKAAIIGILVLVFCIPVQLIKGIVDDRQSTKTAAESEIVEKAGGGAVLGAAYLSLPVEYTEESLNDKGLVVKRRVKRDVIVMPTELAIKAGSRAELRKRGIYEVPVYSADVSLDASFEFKAADSGLELPSPIWDDARLVMEIQDARALAEAPVMSSGGSRIAMRAAAPGLGYLKRAVSAPAKLSAPAADGQSRAFSASIALKLNGADSIRFISAGESTRIALSGDWKSPSFSGYRLPNERELADSGFTASWYSDDSSRPFPRVFNAGTDYAASIQESLFGMDFQVPADAYLQAHRALRYAILFIFIPFAALFLIEVILKRKIHPLQYILVGLADSLFYLLLLSLSEHIPFMAAYLIAAAAVTAVLTVYVAAALGRAKRALFIVPVLLAAQYTYLYCALVSEDYALLIGSIGLFAIVAATMIGTRKIDWYAPRGPMKAKRGPEPESLITGAEADR